MTDIQAVLDFWYGEAMREHWFASTPELDRAIRDRFEQTWQRAADGALDDWAQSADGALALVIILDQLPLNMFRGEAKSFSTEAKAVEVTKRALQQGFDHELPEARRSFLLMPLMHSENPADQDLAVEAFKAHGLEGNLRFAEHHRDIVRRFGRFPHRNAILGRESSAEELAYLASKQAFTG